VSGSGHSRRSDGQQGFAECPLCLQWRPNLCVATNRRDVPKPAGEQMRNIPCAEAELFDHLVGAGEHDGRKFDPERLGCLEIEHQPQLGGSLYREIGRLCAL
jgi:hypothetical protein